MKITDPNVVSYLDIDNNRMVRMTEEYFLKYRTAAQMALDEANENTKMPWPGTQGKK